MDDGLPEDEGKWDPTSISPDLFYKINDLFSFTTTKRYKFKHSASFPYSIPLKDRFF